MRTFTLFLFLGLLTAFSGVPLAPPEAPRTFALFIYCTTFKDAAAWSKLENIESEVSLLATELTDKFGVQCQQLKNPQTPEEIIRFIQDHGKKVSLQPEDRLMVFMSSHGYYNEDSNAGYLIPSDGDPTDEHFSTTWLSYDVLGPALVHSKSRHVLLLLDACYSGSFLERYKNEPDEPDYAQKSDCAQKISVADRYKSRLACTSGNKNQRTPADSKFAKKLLEVLRTKDIITLKDLRIAFLDIEDPTPETGYFKGHEPGGDFILLKKELCSTPKTVNDRDRDDVPDERDHCPDTFGPATNNGCPVISTDKDKDTDGDGLTDIHDNCPLDYGSAKANGCPDVDNDGVPDKSDKCPLTAGETHWQGCPDTDGDGVPDHKDNCPNEKGAINENGCPPSDSDGDGVPDESDKCPKDIGDISNEGCPLPGLEMVLVTGGTFGMGCISEKLDCSDDEKPAHMVVISDFYIGQYEVTQRLWREIMGSDPKALYFKGCSQCPVEGVSWNDVQVFLKKLNAKYPTLNYRLPTEAEWEYAARQRGEKVLFGNGKNIANSNELNFDAQNFASHYSVKGEFRQKTTPVGSFIPNALNLYDMSGNVFEWCQDWYHEGYHKAPSDGSAWTYPEGTYRVIRGGAWSYQAQNCRTIDRNGQLPNERISSIGFRLARTP